MAEILFTQTREYRDHIAGMSYGQTTADQKVTIFRSPGKVAVVLSQLIVGVPRHAKNKRYYEWRSTKSSGFRRNSKGTIVPFSCERHWDFKSNKNGKEWRHKLPSEPFNLLHGVQDRDNAEATEVFKWAVGTEFDIRTEHDLYPMLDKYGLPGYHTIPGTLTMPFRSDDWEVFATKVFGKKRMNPKMLRAVQSTEAYTVAYAQQFRGLVPDHELIRCMYRNRFDEEMEECFVPHTPRIRKYLLNAHPSVATNLVRTNLDWEDLKRIYRFVQLGERNTLRYASMSQPVNSWSDLIR